MLFQFRVELKETDIPVWREVIIPEQYTLYQLHMVIQAAFGWENAHLFQFSENGVAEEKNYSIPYGWPDEGEIIDARTAPVKSVFRKIGDVQTYVYDFGDHWQHKVELVRRTNKDGDWPVCTGGSGACPPEDVGGVDGYRQLLRVMNTPGQKETQSHTEWLGLMPGEKWDAGFFSLREARKRISMLISEF